MPGNTSDKTTLAAFLNQIEAQYGKAQRTWIMDRGIAPVICGAPHITGYVASKNMWRIELSPLLLFGLGHLSRHIIFCV